jgi:capsular polysaccharide transport system permease protein
VSHSDQIPQSSFVRFFADLREGARRQGNVVFALIFRELKSRSNTEGYGLLPLLGVLFEPVLGVAAMAAFWYLMKREEVQGVHIVLFLAVSITAFSIVRRSIASVPRTVRSNRAFYSFPNVKPFDSLLARFIIEVTLTIVGGALMLFLIWWFMDLSILMNHFIQAAAIMGLFICAGFGISLVLGVYGTRFPVVFRTISFLSRGLIFVSAVVHPAAELPSEAQTFIAANPLAHGMELLRAYTFGIRPFQEASFTYFAGFAAVSLFLGLIVYYPNRMKILEQ